jgi:hypothetical protein
MTEEELKYLAEKVENNTCTPEEKLLFLKEFNQNLVDLYLNLKQLKSNNKLDSIRKDLMN